MKKQPDQYFQVITAEQENSADILLYGRIGQDQWWDEDRKKERITDIAFRQALSELESRYQRINIRINSPGGSVYHGDAIIAAIRNCKAEIHTYNDGMAASIAAVIWLSGHQRHMTSNAKLMIHSTSTPAFGTAKVLRQEADRLDTFDAASVALIAEVTGMSEDDVTNQFFDYEDHWFTAAESKEMGLIDKIEDYKTEGTPANVEQMTYVQLMEHFSEHGDQVSQNWLSRLRDRISYAFQPAPVALQTQIINQNSEEMNLENLTTSLENGDISLNDVTQLLKSKGYTVQAPKSQAEQAAESMSQTVIAAVQDAIKPLNEKIEKLEGDIVQLGQQPGDTETQTPAPGALTAKQAWMQQQAVKESNDKFAEAAKSGDKVKFTS